ncbi:MAG: phosphoesterase RecJ domain-containing protein [Ruminococcaceae bacterium]|nr:phosphoesterase RecJ domain-containing protein [Oscillospiraceae bacterium]
MNTPQTAAFLKKLDNVLLLTHVRPDGDTVGCAAALCQALRDTGRTSFILHNPEITATYEPYAAPYWAPADFAPTHVVAVDIAAPGLLPENAKQYAGRIELCIDHHPSNSGYARHTCVDASAGAAGELLYEIIRVLTPITPAIALPLYVAIATDTGCFVYSNTTSRTHRIAAELLELIDVSAVNKALFRTKSRTRLAMESRMVADMTFCDGGRAVVMRIPLSLRQELGATEADIEELSSLAALVEDTDCGITLRELEPGTVKISVRSGPRVDACAVCAALGGGGHRAAAGATVRGTLAEAEAAVLRALAEATEA